MTYIADGNGGYEVVWGFFNERTGYNSLYVLK